MLDSLTSWLQRFVSTKSVGSILAYGFIARLALLGYSIFHDSRIDHIKYTDIDYSVFTNGSRAVVEQRSPYDDTEYRYPPIVALLFVPNILLECDCFGKLLLIVVDILCGQLNYRLNIYQGTNRLNSKLYLLLWLLNPVTIAISTRGSFEPILTLLLLTSFHLLMSHEFILSGLVYGLAIHIRLYPIIYSICLFGYMIQKRPFLITQSKLSYWFRTFSPNFSQVKFFTATLVSLSATCYISYLYYGQDYLEQSFIYHLKRKDLQHNFSVYFYLYKLLPNHQEQLSRMAFISQAIGIIGFSFAYLSWDTNRRTKLRKLSFSLFGTTFLFVSLNKICTSQYFTWYLAFIPLILDSLRLETQQAYSIVAAWFLSQANWLFFAYLLEYQKMDVIAHVGNSSILFLLSNLWILSTLCQHFDASTKNREGTRDL